MESIDLSASFCYLTRDEDSYLAKDEDDYVLFKDKATAPVRLSRFKTTEELNKAEGYERNYLLQGISGPYDLNLRHLKDYAKEDQEYWEHTTLMAIKLEAKKPSPRMFFMATAQDRLIFSKFEDNVARYVAKKPGSSSGHDVQSMA